MSDFKETPEETKGSDGSNGSGGGCNRGRTPLKSKCQFTLNNYTEKMIEKLLSKLDQKVVWRYTFQEEIAPSTGTPHLQGAIEMSKGKRKRMHEWIGIDGFWTGPMDNPAGAHAYCCDPKKRKPGGKVWTNFRHNKPLKCLALEELYEWQRKVVDMVDPSKEIDDRKVCWFWSVKGAVGKSQMMRYLVIKHDAIVCSGKASDMKNMIVNYIDKSGGLWPEIVVMDIPRKMESFISYTGMEEIKGGIFANSKYETGMVKMNPPHMIVFANFPPETEAMSLDRWDIVNLDSDAESDEEM